MCACTSLPPSLRINIIVGAGGMGIACTQGGILGAKGGRFDWSRDIHKGVYVIIVNSSGLVSLRIQV